VLKRGLTTGVRIGPPRRVQLSAMRLRATEVDGEQLPETFPAVEANMSANASACKGISNLSASERRAVELTKLHEMALKEASAATGTRIAALKVSVHRG
jgi:RNA polymerase sigma-70 factor, ECF subfamily